MALNTIRNHDQGNHSRVQTITDSIKVHATTASENSSEDNADKRKIIAVTNWLLPITHAKTSMNEHSELNIAIATTLIQECRSAATNIMRNIKC